MLEIVNVRIYGRRPAVIRMMTWRSPEKPRGVFSHGGGTGRSDLGFGGASGGDDEDHKPGERLRFSDSDSDEEDKALSASSIRVFIEDAKQVRQDEEKKVDEELESETTMQESKNDKKD